ncbi:MAG: DUF1801 domain-containing protein [Mesorhizobium sp.]
MAGTSFKTVDDYLAQQPEHSRPLLDELRAIIRAELPDAQECISYQIPAYKRDGVTVIFFAGWKAHVSLYPVGERVVLEFPEAAAYPIKKGTIRFPLDAALPVELVRKIIGYRAKQASEEARKKSRQTKQGR